MIHRIIKEQLIKLKDKFPVVSVTGPRQSGKTTLVKSYLPEYQYENLEDPNTRLLAKTDPMRFLRSHDHMIIDEIQRIPELFSYIQAISDDSNINGQFIISGSQSFLLNQQISQSLAGRVAILHLLPFSLNELKNHGIHMEKYEEIIYKGFYPRLYDKNIGPVDFYPNYIQTYIERDVRLLQNIHDLTLFVRFLKLCAGRVGQLLNMSSLANDCSVSVNTIKSWLSVLETSFIIFFLQPHFKNFSKRLVKMPKLYFYDTGLASALLDIHNANQLSTHYLLGALFENMIISEWIKKRFHNGLRNNCYFWRDNKGNEIDCIIEEGEDLTPVEIKSGHTFNESFFKNIKYWNKITGKETKKSYIVYGGKQTWQTSNGILLAWNDLKGFEEI